MEKLYKDFSNKQLILRDHLAIDRTILANESTLLAYIRTSLAMIVTGAGLIKFFFSDFSLAIGITFILSGIIVFILGYIRFLKMASRINTLRERD